jgi:hypothetical protein
MDKIIVYITQMTQELKELDSGKEGTRMRPKLPFKNAFDCNFLVFIEVYFSSLKHANYMNYVITILTQLTESKSEA